jgi:hydrogenase maturation protease
MLLIGVGNKMRGDDGVGVWVAEQVAHQHPTIRTRILSGEGAGVIDALAGESRVVLVDATRSGKPAGSIGRIDAIAQQLPSGLFNYSSHAFGVAEAIEMARVLGQLPVDLTIYGVEGGSFAAGEGLSAEVLQAAKSIVIDIIDYERTALQQLRA